MFCEDSACTHIGAPHSAILPTIPEYRRLQAESGPPTLGKSLPRAASQNESGCKQLKVPSETPPAVQSEAAQILHLGLYFHLNTLDGHVGTSWRTSAWDMKKASVLRTKTVGIIRIE
ncbi:jg22951 [Pararge aegeria aegeria]|uniref:Jg22951 protein n=1 Tax=Pararge aegeria aegeria TaxID=348720 RepID=A0A8S4QWS1_9NEOP|nr:jg22951 [Pararge aegeria aegeria]